MSTRGAQGDESIALMMEAASTSEKSVNFYQTTRRNNPEDIHLHTRPRDNLKSHINIESVQYVEELMKTG
jgi:hypothetical protein